MLPLEKTQKHPRKMIRVLVYPNITYQRDLEKDSYIQVIYNQIRLLNDTRNNLWFYLLLPKHLRMFDDFDNVTVWTMPFPTYPPAMRSHFDVSSFSSMVSSNYDFDLVMSHLPEHTHAVKNVLYNLTHHTPPVFGYSHWFDLKQVVSWSMDSFLQNITGLLEYNRCYLNTKHQKDLVLTQAAETFNAHTVEKLRNILTVQHLGVFESDIRNAVNFKPKRTIVFNHRPDSYKHFDNFLSIMDTLWSQRQDFDVWVPLLKGQPPREYIRNDRGNKQWYYNELHNCTVGFSPKQTYGGWSVATTDGMMNGVPYIMYNDTYYHELWPKADFFSNDEEVISLLNLYLDNNEYRNSMAQKALNYVRNNLVYRDEVESMSLYMDSLLKKQRAVRETPKLTEILSWIAESGSISKKDLFRKLNWGRGIKWSPYRRALMENPNVYDTYTEEPTYVWVE